MKEEWEAQNTPRVLDQRYTATYYLPITYDFDEDQTWHSKDYGWNFCAAFGPRTCDNSVED